MHVPSYLLCRFTLPLLSSRSASGLSVMGGINFLMKMHYTNTHTTLWEQDFMENFLTWKLCSLEGLFSLSLQNKNGFISIFTRDSFASTLSRTCAFMISGMKMQKRYAPFSCCTEKLHLRNFLRFSLFSHFYSPPQSEWKIHGWIWSTRKKFTNFYLKCTRKILWLA